MTRFLDIARKVRSTKDLYRRLCLSYAVAAILWLVGLDWALARALDESALVWVIPLKNALFALLSALGLWDFARRFLNQRWEDEEEIGVMQERLRLLSEASHDAIWLTRAQKGGARLVVEYANASFAAIWGRPPERIKGVSSLFDDWIHEEDAARAKPRVQRFFAGEGEPTLDIEFRLKRPDGSDCWVWTKAELMRGRRGEWLRVAGVTRDLTERKRAELALRESERLFRSLFDSSQEPIAFCGVNGAFLDANIAFQELTGYTREELQGLYFQSLTRNGWRQEERRIFREQLGERGFSDVYEKECQRKDGAAVPVNVRLSLVRDDAGRPAGIFAIVRDITGAKAQYDELLRAKEGAESTQEAQNRFLRVVSHELRTPLNPIIGYADLLLSQIQDPMQRDFLEIIREAALSMSSLIGDILDMARIEVGEAEVESSPFRIPELLNAVAGQMQPSARAYGNELRVEYLGRECAVRGDKEKIRQSLLNLVSNACKFTRNGRVALRCLHTAGEGEGAVFRFEVEDNGIGIDEAQQAVIFQPFQQAEQARGLGVGLGLTIVDKLVTAMGGSVSVSSRPGRGSTFGFDLPLPIEELESPASSPADLGQEEFEGLELREVLVVEDDSANRRFATDLLTHFGCRVTTAQNGEDCLKYLQERRFDLVLMDVSMPVMNGFEATERLRREGGPNAEAPVIALTATASRETEAACRRSGMNDVVTKPISMESFEGVLRRWLEKSGRQAGA